ncbi:P-loop NTPase family protein [Mycobacteroides abscessus]|uniref:ATP-binding protein n=1 Tax=Mycobacteroides abscessus TaxID=36809 RepID=UPI0009A89830|nr:ATP-binding protein [Mycobacteroides abscessus]SKG72601.1 Uncharacterised protein [Mycobacteroides abscessus subsp. bolletii]SKG98228.1 Uncharacterised protein [Mycobacteroides abscessus subsp. bolletii]SKH91807.1 Uncharacterised protein [Mycobacteroides abscessus subsp. bolletii]SKH93300.1 Uncharacterised protein [Mycobacteroides abscessus subsp. bolletii]SKH97128.1 Uncharacterised protein [Mycobacteroides abscessus subsp. bolletii]
MSSGGWSAASGFFYQYLFTIETFFDLIAKSWPDDAQIHIEDPRDGRILDPHIVDFAVHHPRDGLHAVYQAKSVISPHDTEITVARALPVLVRMSRSAESQSYILTTNALPGGDIDALNALLGSDCSDGELLVGLQHLARNSERATAALATVDSPEWISRLRRCRVQTSGEPAGVIRERIVESIARWRSRNRLPLGAYAADLLENALINDIFSRAAGTRKKDLDTEYRVVTLAEFCQMLAPGVDVLAQATACVEAGRGIEHVPNGQGIERPKQLEWIAARFSDVREGSAQLSALVGPSGIGKSRLAAMYAHGQCDTYDRICWIDAESDASIIASIDRQKRTIVLPEVNLGDVEEVSAAFKACIRSFIGRWLIVLDNARDSRQLQRWIAFSGNAHFLATSTNSVDWSGFGKIKVGHMELGEAHALIRARLDDDMCDAGPERQHSADAAIRRLAKTLAWRPLALQLAASHFGTLSTLLTGIDMYVSRIEHLAALMNDDTLDREDYPRTLQAAIQICLDRLESAAQNDPLNALAAKMLIASSVLAPRSIPAFLLFAAVTEPIEAAIGSSGPGEHVLQQLPRMNSAIRRLGIDSLVERQNDVTGAVAPELRIRLDVNEIVQIIARQYAASLTGVINTAAAHLGSWTACYINRQDFSAAAVVQPHALNLLEIAKETGGEVPLCAVLAGNLSSLLTVQNRSDEALRWLMFELQLLDNLPSPHHRLNAATTAQIAQAMVRTSSDFNALEEYLSGSVHALEETAQAQDTQWDGARVCYNNLEIVDTFIRQGAVDVDSMSRLRQYHDRLEALLTVFPDNGHAEQQQLYKRIEKALDESRHRDVLTLSEMLTERIEASNHILRIGNRVQRLQALAGLGESDELLSELDDLAHDHELYTQVKEGICQSLLNAGAYLAFRIVADETDQKGEEAFRQIIRLSGNLLSNDYERYLHTVLAAYEASITNDVHGVMGLLKLVTSQSPPTPPGTVRATSRLAATLVAWLTYWVACAEKGARAHAVEAMVYRRTYGVTVDGPTVCQWTAEIARRRT